MTRARHLAMRMGRLLAAAVVGFTAASLAGCGERSVDAGDGRPVLVASIHPLADLLRQVAGDDFEVRALLPANASPHGFEIKPEQLRLLGRADVLVTVGLGLDPWADRAAARSGEGVEVLRMSEMVGAAGPTDAEAHHEHHEHDEHGGHDHHDHDTSRANAHLWLDPVTVRAFVDELGAHLVGRYPEHAERIVQRMSELLASIEQVDVAYREQLANVKRRELVTFHNAFDLLAERYGLTVVTHLTPIELNPGGEVTPGRLMRAVDAVREHDLKVIYAEPQFSDQAVIAIQRETGVAVLRLDPIEDSEKTWQQTMLSNLAVLVDGQNR